MNVVIGYNFEDTEKAIRKKGKRLREFLSDYTFFDLETTDVNINFAEIIEIAAVKVRNNQIIGRFEQLVKPSGDIPHDIELLTGITNEMVKNEPTIETVLPKFIDFCGNDVLVGHNINAYDLNILYDVTVETLGLEIRNDFVDTLDLSKCLIDLDLPKYNLKTLCDYFKVTNENAHRAMGDVLANNECYQKMKEFKIGAYKFSNSEQKSCLLFKCPVDISEKRICLTGDFKSGSRDYIKQRLTELGARVTNSISKKTNYLLVGDFGTTTTHKLTDASAMGVNVVYEKDFIITEGE